MKRALVGILALGLIIGSIGSSVGMGQKPETGEIMEANEGARKEYLAKQEEEREKLKKKVPELIEKLKTAKGFKRERIILQLGWSKDPRVVESLIEVLSKDENSNLRALAAQSLGWVGDKKAIPTLRNSLNDEDKKVQSQAAVALFNLGDESIEPVLMTFVKEGNDSALEALCFTDINERIMRSEKSKLILREVLSYSNEHIRILAAFYLAETDQKDSTYPVAVDILQNGIDPGNRSLAIYTLTKIGSEEAISAIASALDDEDKLVSNDAKQALKKLNREDIIKEHFRKK